jgi:hypothetical protein
MLAHRETAALAERLIRETCERQGIEHHQLTIHADLGSSMTSKPVALMLADLGVTKSHSRPHVSNDNPYSESQFKTMKYRPDVPDRFGSIEHGRSHCGDFFAWYNSEHRHGGLGLLTPHDVHHGLAARLQAHDGVLATAFAARPERFPAGAPSARAVPSEVWINKPQQVSPTEEARQQSQQRAVSNTLTGSADPRGNPFGPELEWPRALTSASRHAPPISGPPRTQRGYCDCAAPLLRPIGWNCGKNTEMGLLAGEWSASTARTCDAISDL